MGVWNDQTYINSVVSFTFHVLFGLTNPESSLLGAGIKPRFIRYGLRFHTQSIYFVIAENLVYARMIFQIHFNFKSEGNEVTKFVPDVTRRLSPTINRNNQIRE